MVKSDLPKLLQETVELYRARSVQDGVVRKLCDLHKKYWQALKLDEYQLDSIMPLSTEAIADESFMDKLNMFGEVLNIETYRQGNNEKIAYFMVDLPAGAMSDMDAKVYNRLTAELSVELANLAQVEETLTKHVNRLYTSYSKAATDYDRDALYRTFEAIPSLFDEFGNPDSPSAKGRQAARVWTKQDGHRY